MRKRIKNKIKSYTSKIPSIPEDVKNDAAKTILNTYILFALCFAQALIAINNRRDRRENEFFY